MKLNKKILSALFLLLFVLIAAVSAADNSDLNDAVIQDYNDNDNNDIGIVIDEKSDNSILSEPSLDDSVLSDSSPDDSVLDDENSIGLDDKKEISNNKLSSNDVISNDPISIGEEDDDYYDEWDDDWIDDGDDGGDDDNILLGFDIFNLDEIPDEYGNIIIEAYLSVDGENLTGEVLFEIFNEDDDLVLSKTAPVIFDELDVDGDKWYNSTIDLTGLLPKGYYTLNATYLGDENYGRESLGDEIIYEFTIEKNIPTFTFTKDLNEYGDLFIDAIVNNDADGDVSFRFISGKSEKISIVSVENGHAYYENFDVFEKGTYDLVIEFLGDNNYYGAKINTSVTFTKNNPKLAVSVDVNEFGSIIIDASLDKRVNGDINFSIYYEGQIDEDGYVCGLIDEIKNGKVSFNQYIRFLNGSYDVYVVFDGNDDFYKAVYTTTVEVTKLLPHLNVNSIKIDDYGNLIVNASVEESATGSMTFDIDNKMGRVIKVSVPVENGISYCVEKNIASEGDYEITVKYLGDNHYFAEEEVTSTVSLKSIPDFDLIPSVSDSGNLIIDGRLNSNATGNISLLVYENNSLVLNSSQSIKDGSIHYESLPLEKGDYEILASYLGDWQYYMVDKSSSISLIKEVPNLSILPSVNGGVIFVNATIDKAAIGLIKFDIIDANGRAVSLSKDIQNGEAIFDDEMVFAKGNYTVMASFAGDDNFYNASVSQDIFVDKGISRLVLTNVADQGSFIICDAIVVAEGNPSGNIVFTVYKDGKLFNTSSVPIENSIARLDLEGVFEKGDYRILANYSGDANYCSSFNEMAFRFDKSNPNLEISASAADDGSISINASVDNGASGNILFEIKDTNNKAILVYAQITNGTAKFDDSTLFDIGDYQIRAIYAGDSNYLNDSISTNISVKSKYVHVMKASQINCSNMTTKAITSALVRDGKYFVYTLLDEDGNPLVGKTVLVGFNGHVYNYTTDENGQAKTQVNLRIAGGYTFAICFLGDEDYNSTFAVAKITVEKQKPSLTVPAKNYKANAKTKTLTATFKDAKGVAVKGKKITFTVNGKSYTATSNANGIASVKVSLNSKGSYSFVAKYNGDDTFLAVTHSAKLVLK
ncbi:Ig-like domain-containing protein [uncultured Methanobrevibacter sp.]|uniref:Ig-like domain-containing protein n=1 Tax=uncultured Methanobrevibacter sp. TaxID=253161 RepID=UPI0026150371